MCGNEPACSIWRCFCFCYCEKVQPSLARPFRSQDQFPRGGAVVAAVKSLVWRDRFEVKIGFHEAVVAAVKSLVLHDRFEVKIGFHKAVVTAVKSLKTGRYNAAAIRNGVSQIRVCPIQAGGNCYILHHVFQHFNVVRLKFQCYDLPSLAVVQDL